MTEHARELNKVNDLHGKTVINQSTGERIATVSDVVLSRDARRIVALVVGGGLLSNDERVIPWSGVHSVGDYVIFEGHEQLPSAHEDAEIDELRKDAHRITGKTVIGANGERLGTVGDMYYDAGGTIVGIDVRRGGVFPGSGDTMFLRGEHIQTIGKDAVIVSVSDLGTAEAGEPGWIAPPSREAQAERPRDTQGPDPLNPLDDLPPDDRRR